MPATDTQPEPVPDREVQQSGREMQQSGREVQPRDREDVSANADAADRLGVRRRPAADAAGMDTGNGDAGGARNDDR